MIPYEVKSKDELIAEISELHRILNTIKIEDQSLRQFPIGAASKPILVDDEEMIREMASTMLNNLGYQVNVCNDGREAITFYQKHWPTIDLVILDMLMPHLGGKETFMEMKKINPKIMVLLSSGYSMNGEAQLILEHGAQGFIQKPYRRSDLSQKIKAIINR